MDFILLPSPCLISLWHGHRFFRGFILGAELTTCSHHSDQYNLFLKCTIKPKIVVIFFKFRFKDCNGI